VPTFVRPEGFHSLDKDDVVEFDIIDGAKGPRADQVLVIAQGSHIFVG
jgi:cold shock CspA family protein